MSVREEIDVVESTDPLAVPRRVALVRPDTRPEVRRSDERYVMTFPHLIAREIILFQVVVVALSVAAIVFDAPLEGIANPLETPNPAKAPWYFLGLQELLHYFPPIVAGVLLPGLVVLSLVVIPYARINLTAGPLWSPSGSRRTALALAAVKSVGTAIGQQAKAAKRAKSAAVTVARTRAVRLLPEGDQSGPALRLTRAYGITTSARTTRPGRRTPATIGGK